MAYNKQFNSDYQCLAFTLRVEFSVCAAHTSFGHCQRPLLAQIGYSLSDLIQLCKSNLADRVKTYSR